MPLDVARRGTLDKRDPPLKAIVAANDDYEAGYHKGNVGGLDAIDPHLATANIKHGITIFGFAGSADVHDISDATAIEAEVITGETFYAASGGIRTGTMPIEALDPALNKYPAGYHAGAASLTAVDAQLVTGSIKYGITIFGVAGHTNVRDSSDATATATRVRSGYTFYAGGGARKTGTLATKTLSPDNDTVATGYYAATTLHAVDAHLAAGNIKEGITIFGFLGTLVEGVDVSDANALVTDVKSGKTFYSVAAPRKTGTMPTVAITAANDNYPAGYHAGNAGGLDAIDTDLKSDNIKYGITIFGKAGSTNVRNVSDANAAVANVLSPKTFYAGGGARKTGTMATRTLSPDNDTVQAGYYAATTLSTVDTHLAPANIKLGVNIFGKVGTLALEPVLTTEISPTFLNTTDLSTLWLTKWSATIGGAQKLVLAFINIAKTSADLIYVRILYNGVEKATRSVDGNNTGCAWAGDGLGSSALLELQFKGPGALRLSGGCWSVA